MTKTLNQAFLVAFSKDAAVDPRIPAPHAFSRESSRAADRDVQAGDASASSVPSRPPHASIPSPHVAFPDEPQPTINPQQTWIISELSGSAESLLSLPPLLVTSIPAAGAAAAPSSPSIEINEPPIATPAAPSARSKAESTSDSVAQAVAAPATAVPPRDTKQAAAARQPQPQETPAPSAAQTAARQREFQAAWEVDELGWSSNCQQLCQHLGAAFGEAGNQLRSATGEGLRVLAISSAYRGEGRTSTALLLARAAAQAGVRVAVLDADLDNPHLGRELQISLPADWIAAIHEQQGLEEAAVGSLTDRLVVFPLRAEAREQQSRIDGTQFTALLNELKTQFELLIVDLGPSSSDERRLFPRGPAGLIDAAIVVRDVRSTAADESERVAQQWRERGVAAVGIAENYVREE